VWQNRCYLATAYIMRGDATQPSASSVEEPAKSGSIRDGFTIWPLVLTVGFPVLLVLVWTGPFELAFVGAPIVLSMWAVAALLALFIAIVSASNRAWRPAISMLVLPLASLAAILNSSAFWSFAIDTGERIHFQLMRASYLSQVAKLPANGEPRFAIWNWGGFVIGHAVVYDESGEIVLPMEKQSPAWKKKIAGTELSCGVWGTPVGDHFYIVRTGC
jgi:hypothetical protein